MFQICSLGQSSTSATSITDGPIELTSGVDKKTSPYCTESTYSSANSAIWTEHAGQSTPFDFNHSLTSLYIWS